MKTVHDYLRSRILENAGIFKKERAPTIEKILELDWNNKFIRFMKNRIIMGFLRYGSYNVKTQKKYNRIKSIKTKLEMFEKTGNGEALVDIANQCMIIFTMEDHKNFHWQALDDKQHMME